MTNQEVREWYNKQVSQIPIRNEEWIKQGLDAEQRAKKAWKIRHDARIKAREMMENPSEVEDLRKRDMKVYGNPDGPTFEHLIERERKQGLDGDKIYEAIIKGSYTTNEDVNKRVNPD